MSRVTSASLILFVMLSGGACMARPVRAAQNAPSIDVESIEGALVKGSRPDVFVIEHGLRRSIPSEEVYKAFFFTTRRIERMSDEAIASIPKGEPLGIFSSWPDGTLLKGKGNRVYLVQKNARRWVVNEKVFGRWGFLWQRITVVSDDVLNRLAEGSPVIGARPGTPETTILSGPPVDKPVETTTVTFTFTGTTGEGTRDVDFETFLDGFDTRWSTTSRAERTFDLPREEKQYMFYVRAVAKNGTVDPTPARRTFTIRFSPFGNYVRIASISSGTFGGGNEQIAIDVNTRASAAIDLTDYTVTNSLGYQFRLPKVQNYYRSGGVLPTEDNLIIPPGGRVTVVVGTTPLGKSVRLNRCMKYLERTTTSSYAYTTYFGDCPAPTEEQIRRETGSACFEYIRRQGACSMPNPIPFPDNVKLGFSCIDFISRHYNYNGCVDDRQTERDFYLNEWKVEIGYPQKFFPTGKESVELRDREGRIVDSYKSWSW